MEVEGVPWWVWIIQGLVAIASVVNFIQTGRAKKTINTAVTVVRAIEKAVGRPDPGRAYPTTGQNLAQKVESLDLNQIEMLKLMMLMVQDTNASRGPGKRRINTDSIQLPKEINNGK